MKLKLQILSAAIIVLAIYIPTARAQANLTFSGGNNTPLTTTLQGAVTYTLTAPCRVPFPIFQNTGSLFTSNTMLIAAGTMTYSINGGTARGFSSFASGLSLADISQNDIFIGFPNSNADPTLPVGTIFVLNPGTLTTTTNVAPASPTGGSFTTFLICASTNVGTRTSSNGTAIVTAAAVSVSGRVLTNTNRGLMNAVVYLTDQAGNTRAARTNPFGYYQFNDIPSGQTVIMSVVSKRYQFAPQVLNVSEDIQNFDFTVPAFLR